MAAAFTSTMRTRNAQDMHTLNPCRADELSLQGLFSLVHTESVKHRARLDQQRMRTRTQKMHALNPCTADEPSHVSCKVFRARGHQSAERQAARARIA